MSMAHPFEGPGRGLSTFQDMPPLLDVAQLPAELDQEAPPAVVEEELVPPVEDIPPHGPAVESVVESALEPALEADA